MNGTYSILEDISEFKVVTSLSTRRPNGKLWTVFNVTFNGCDLLDPQELQGNPIAVSYLKEVRKFLPDLPKKCPIKKNIDYSLRYLLFNEDKFPTYLPVKRYFIFFGVTRMDRLIAKFNIVGEVISKNSEKYRKLFSKDFN
ncbi:uncharacterized protein [Musca autumnalis]|uniref:uncharacterized protein n=1 Tax=Musca autumnalis TaxID=221902 RepID=UPI003CF91554